MNNELLKYYQMTTKELAKKLKAEANWHGQESYLFLPDKPKGKICLVAHIDTVFSEYDKIDKKKDCLTDNPRIKKSIFYDKDKRVAWSPQGLGADDRTGVWACLELFKTIPEPYKPIVLLTDGEETGGSGAYEAIDIFKDYLKDVSYFIELDRKGKGEAVFYNGESQDFIDYIASFGFKESFGSFSDISILCPEFQKCGVNLSIGYHNAHFETEFQDMNDLDYTMNVMPNILKDTPKDMSGWKLDPLWDTSRFDYGKYGLCGHGKYGYGLSKYSEYDYLECPRCKQNLVWSDVTMGYCPFCGRDLSDNKKAFDKMVLEYMYPKKDTVLKSVQTEAKNPKCWKNKKKKHQNKIY